MDHFLKACGAAGPLRLIVEKRGLPGAVRRSFSQPFVLIGRDSRADLFLDHPRVSRRHVSLQMIEGRVYCVDLASRTGTRWEDGPARSGWLERPSGICVGPFAIQLEHDSDPTSSLAHGQAEPMDPLVTRPSDRDDLPRVVLEFPRESSRLLQWRMNCALALVGNSPHCKIRLLDPSVSGFHCSLVRAHEGMWVVDLLGRGGITVNRASVRSARLEDGDELRVGEIPIRICCESSASKAREAVPAPSKAERTTTLVVSESIPGDLMPRPWEIAWPSPIRQAGGMLAAGSSSETELTGTALAMFLNQFGQMQRQMLDQFQQSTMMMFQMFGSMHTEQMEMIREELARLREIGETLESLKAEVKTATERAGALPLVQHPGDLRRPPLPSRLRPGPRYRVTGREGPSRPRAHRLGMGPLRAWGRDANLRRGGHPRINLWDRAQTSMRGCSIGSRRYTRSSKAAGRRFSP